jgi:hypothetical protein
LNASQRRQSCLTRWALYSPQASGKIYDSKSKLRQEYKQLGMVEVGNDPARNRPKPKHKPDRKAISDTIQKAKARFDRGERTRDELKFK